MARRLRRSAPAALLAILALPGAAPAADTLYAVSKDDRLITINSSVPANLERAVRILGLPQGERVLAIDVRPENDTLMGVTTSSRIVELNPVTGLARPVGRQVPFSPALSGGSFGFDFNPTVDRIRLVSDADQNLRIGPNTGLTTFRDDRLAYAPGDPSARTNPAVGASAYSNSVAGATTTTLFGIDSGRDTLVRQDPPNDGVLNTVGRLGVDAVEPVAFDITPAGVGYASFRRAGQKGTELFSVSLAGGRARGTA
ncbi:MAG: DUF4394 domain-containing protein, partial [Solirubrobacterales bacterium]|nr:DUF4394 domain-containing protein [Solirubrobacterales bacterium]